MVVPGQNAVAPNYIYHCRSSQEGGLLDDSHWQVSDLDDMGQVNTEMSCAHTCRVFLQRWHLGDFFYKGTGREVKTAKGGYAYTKWPVSNPGLHGFDVSAIVDAAQTLLT